MILFNGYVVLSLIIFLFNLYFIKVDKETYIAVVKEHTSLDSVKEGYIDPVDVMTMWLNILITISFPFVFLLWLII